MVPPPPQASKVAVTATIKPRSNPLRVNFKDVKEVKLFMVNFCWGFCLESVNGAKTHEVAKGGDARIHVGAC